VQSQRKITKKPNEPSVMITIIAPIWPSIVSNRRASSPSHLPRVRLLTRTPNFWPEIRHITQNEFPIKHRLFSH